MKQIIKLVSAVAMVALIAAPAFADSIAVNGSAALDGSFGLETTIDGTGDAYVVTSHPSAETTYTFSFLVDPNDLNMAAGSSILIGSIRKTDPPTRNFWLIYIRKSGSDDFYEIQTNLRQDDGSFPPWQTAVKICSPVGAGGIPCDTVTPVEFEFRWTAASAPGANDGVMEVYKNGTIRKTFGSLDNDGQTIDEAYFGSIFNSGTGTTGSYYFDKFVSTR